MYPHSDPTAARAIGAAEKEWYSMVKLAYRYRTDSYMSSKIREPRRVFNGIFSRLLTDPIEDLEKILFRGNRNPMI